MSKIIALQTDPTTDGNILVVPSSIPTLNGFPIATQGSNLMYKGSPGDQAAEFVPGVLLNNKPLTFVGAKTTAGATILTAGNTTATIEPADSSESQEPEEQEPAEVSKTVELVSDYPMLQICQLATEVAKSTFYLMLSAFFEEDIPIIAYEGLYDALMNQKEEMMPEIEVLSKGLNRGKMAAYNRKTKKIEVKESIVRQAVEGEGEEKEEALAKLLQFLLEEYGHFLDDVLRNQFSSVQGDAKKDEGAVYSYYFTNYKITDPEINYATAKIDGAEIQLIVKLEEIVQSYKEEKERIEADYQDREREYFKAGKGDIALKQYGHFDFEENLLDKGILKNKSELSWLYLGNYMRDMSQLITPVTTEFTKEEHNEMDKLDAGMRGIFKESFFDALKLTRQNWTRVIEVLAASHTMAQLRPEEDKALASFSNQFMSNGKATEDFLIDKAQDAGLKVVQMSLDYVNFIKHFEGFTQEELGVYRPEEHIDNPIYAAVYDNLSSPKSAYYCPPRKNKDGAPQTQPSIGEHYGMKRFIRNEKNGIETDTDTVAGAKGLGDYAGGELPTAVACMKKYFRAGIKQYRSGRNDHDKHKGLSLIGSGLHVLEDYFAHTNFCEILLIKHGISVYPWVNFYDNELKNYGPEKKKFQFKNYVEKKTEQPKETLGDLPFETSEDVVALHYELSLSGTCNLLPSFDNRYRGFYFTYQPKGGVKRLYRADAAKSSQNEQTIEEDPLNLKELCIEKRMKKVYMFHQLKLELVQESSSIVTLSDNKNYPSQIPVVSGYFSGADTFHSLFDTAEKLFSENKINWRTVLMTNDFKFSKAVQLIDMLAYHILTDLMLSQKEEGKPEKQTGVDYSKLMEYYHELIFMRESILGAAETARKRGGLVGILIYLVDRLLNATYAAVMNLVYSIAVEMLRSINHVITDWQNMQLVTDIGTNPSHTQLAKDADHSPIHSLAGDLALKAVLGVGTYIKTLITDKSIDEDSIAEDIIETAVQYMQHPCAANMEWADEVVQKWLGESADRLEQLHEKEFKFHQSVKFGEDVKEIIVQVKKRYAEFHLFIEETYRGIIKEWNTLQEKYTEFKEASDKLFCRGKQYLEKLQREADEFYDQLQQIYKQLWLMFGWGTYNDPEYLQKKDEFRIKLNQFNLKVEEIQQGIDWQEIKEGEIDNLENSLRAFYEKNIGQRQKEILEKQGLGGKVYQYCYVDTKDQQYRKFGKNMHEFYALQLKVLDVEKKYLQKTADEQIGLASRSTRYSFLFDDSDTGIALDESVFYKGKKRKGLI